MLPVGARERIEFGIENYEDVEIAAYSRAVKLDALDPAGGDQIRTWSMGYWSGRMPIDGYVLSAQGAWRCKLTYNNDDGKYMVINRGHCEGPTHHAQRLAAAMALLPELAKFDGQTLECGVMDGGGTSVEGVYAGKRFRFQAQNIDECKGESFQKMAAMLEQISNAYFSKDRE